VHNLFVFLPSNTDHVVTNYAMYTVRLNHNTIKIAIAQERLDSMFGIFYDYSPNVHIITTNKTTKKRKKPYKC